MGKSSSISGGRGLVGLLLGVLEPLWEPLKSNRMRRTVPRVNCSRQKGQVGGRDDIFSRMLLQQFKHNTCPGKGGRGGEKPVSENFPTQNEGKTDRMGYNGANYEDQTRPRRRRTESQARE